MIGNKIDEVVFSVGNAKQQSSLDSSLTLATSYKPVSCQRSCYDVELSALSE
jgi:hypothetical protein